MNNNKEIQIRCRGSRELPYDKLKTFQGNLKEMTKENCRKLKSSILKYGWCAPVFVWGEDYILDGHGRLLVLAELLKEGYSIGDLPVVDIQADTKKQAGEILLAINSKFQTITDQGLHEFMAAMEIGFDELDGFALDMDLERFGNEYFTENGLTDPDEIPEVTEPTTKAGDLWLLGEHRLLCGDATKVEDVNRLMDGRKADMVFTDPPYGINYSGGRTQVVATKTYGKLKNDDLQGADLGNLLLNVFLNNKSEADVYVCVSPIMQAPYLQFIESSGKKIDAVIVWDKKNAGLGYMAYRRQTEFILFVKGGEFKKGDKSDFDLWSIGKDLTTAYIHGTQKPVALPIRAIQNSSKQGDIVLDLFLGSGSTLIAAEKTGRICFGVELDEHYVSVIIERYENFSGKQAVLDATGETFSQVKQRQFDAKQ